MIINKITFSNFRNFKNEVTLNFDSGDGKINIVYGLNGEGKTTLHQLFQWLFYGTVNFNRTPKGVVLYNLHRANNLEEGGTMALRANADFMHLGKHYSITREKKFKKIHNEIVEEKDKLDLLRETDDHRWISAGSNPQDIINEILPFVFSKYFFFDGERMVDDLKERKSISNNLQKAVYYLFNLQEYADAIDHIGDDTLISTVLGKLNNDIDDEAGTPQALIDEINRRKKYADAKEKRLKDIEELKEKRTAVKERIRELNEAIGASKGSKELEARRTKILNQRAGYEKDLKTLRQNFGKHLFEIFPTILVANKAISAKDEVLKKIKSDVNYVPGLNRTLLEYLLQSNTCICGTTLTAKEKAELEQFDKILPPKSYQSLFHDFIRKCRQEADAYLDSGSEGENILTQYSEKIVLIDQCDNDIRDIDEQLKDLLEVDDYIDQREQAEAEEKEIDHQIETKNGDINTCDLYIKSLDKKIAKMREKQSNFEIVQKKMDLISAVKTNLEHRLDTMIRDCRDTLQINVDKLVQYILTARKTIEVTDDFNLKVSNTLGDEYKNEGTFAVVSFAFILGLLQTLKTYDDSEPKKRYALVLDAPFSKLDIIHKPRIINKLFEYGDQVILFSKDNISEYMDEEHTGSVYLLESSVSDQTITGVKEADEDDVEYYFSDAHVRDIERRKHQ